MIVCSVGDIFSSGYSNRDEYCLWAITRIQGNTLRTSSFMLNCMEYLTDHSGILEARAKDVKLRLLDTGRAKAEKTKWQIINVAIPIVAVLVFASFFCFSESAVTKGQMLKTLSFFLCARH
jgi:ABC-2 type transport system permease protein